VPNEIVFDQTLGNTQKLINSRGDVAFIAPLYTTNGGAWYETNALLLAGASGLQTVARTGDVLPGIPGAQFGVFNALAINDATGLAAKDAVSFNDRLLGDLSGSWQIVALGGSPAPNPPGGSFGQIFAPPQIGGTPVLRQSGVPQWLFQATIFSPPFQPGLWGVMSGLQPYLALSFNGPAPELGGGELLESNYMATVSPPPTSAVVFQGFLKNGAGGVNFGNREVLYSGDSPESAQVLLRTGDPLPVSVDTATWSSFRGLDGNQNGQICFIGDWFGTQSMSGVFLKETGDPTVLVKRGDSAPPGDKRNGWSTGRCQSGCARTGLLL